MSSRRDVDSDASVYVSHATRRQCLRLFCRFCCCLQSSVSAGSAAFVIPFSWSPIRCVRFAFSRVALFDLIFMLANFLLMPFFPSSHVVVVFVIVVVVVAVADRTKQGNTPNDDKDVVVLALVFFLFTSALRLWFFFCFAHCLRCVWHVLQLAVIYEMQFRRPPCPHPCAPIAKLLIRLPRFLAACQVGAKLVNGRNRRRR